MELAGSLGPFWQHIFCTLHIKEHNTGLHAPHSPYSHILWSHWINNDFLANSIFDKIIIIKISCAVQCRSVWSTSFPAHTRRTFNGNSVNVMLYTSCICMMHFIPFARIHQFICTTKKKATHNNKWGNAHNWRYVYVCIDRQSAHTVMKNSRNNLGSLMTNFALFLDISCFHVRAFDGNSFFPFLLIFCFYSGKNKFVNAHAIAARLFIHQLSSLDVIQVYVWSSCKSTLTQSQNRNIWNTYIRMWGKCIQIIHTSDTEKTFIIHMSSVWLYVYKSKGSL